ncbi:MAG: Jag N-terminal domain-containing protein [Chloroflexi bacterium]|nr:Jag N-terminal domain-containing protein [Chloroflexota bacterium]
MVEQSHEFSAKSVEAAIEEGLRQLGVGRDRVDVEILHEGSRGLLGIGSTNARVRMTLRPAARPAEKPAPTPVPAAVAPAPVSTPAVAAIPQEVDESDEDDLPVAVASVLDDNDDEAYDDDSHVDRDEVVALAGEMLLEMVILMGLDARVEGSQRDDPDENDTAIYLNLVGDDLGALIGRHGETLASIQYLVRLMVNQKVHRWTNIVVDVDGYKDRRAEKLAQMALRMADQVVETGRSVALEPMPANERRLIHIALRNHPRVYTESTGEDTRRKIQILLK